MSPERRRETLCMVVDAIVIDHDNRVGITLNRDCQPCLYSVIDW